MSVSVDKEKVEWLSAAAVALTMMITGLVFVSLVRADVLDRLPWAPLGLAIGVLGVLGLFVEGIARAKWWSDEPHTPHHH